MKRKKKKLTKKQIKRLKESFKFVKGGWMQFVRTGQNLRGVWEELK